jgi:Flp pilus assembly protein TadB
MSDDRELFEQFSKLGVGLNVLMVQLFPLALPILLLTLVTLVLVALPLIAIGLALGLVALPVVLFRRLRVGRRSPQGPDVTPGEGFPSVLTEQSDTR